MEKKQINIYRHQTLSRQSKKSVYKKGCIETAATKHNDINQETSQQ